jgi:ornithine cyclodeaminase/alanine dehydrogenase-like protein (mu-crystallin family)
VRSQRKKQCGSPERIISAKKEMAYNVVADAAQKYKEEISSHLDLDVVPVVAPQEAVSGCDIVVTAGDII